MANPDWTDPSDWNDVTDCGDEGCEECDVCLYLSFLDWASSVGKPAGTSIQRDERIEAHLARKAEA